MIKYQNCFFVQGEEAGKLLDILAEFGASDLIMTLDTQGYLEPLNLPNGEPDIRTFEGGVIGVPAEPYFINYSHSLQYIGVGKIVTEKTKCDHDWTLYWKYQTQPYEVCAKCGKRITS